MDFRIDGVNVGEPGTNGEISQLDLASPSSVTVQVDAAALLATSMTEETERIRNSRLDEKPYWHIERCRIDSTRKVPVELIVNGEPVARRELLADGNTRHLEFDLDIAQSSWVVRILPSSHTNPIFINVDGDPIREPSGVSRQSILVGNPRKGKYPTRNARPLRRPTTKLEPTTKRF